MLNSGLQADRPNPTASDPSLRILTRVGAGSAVENPVAAPAPRADKQRPHKGRAQTQTQIQTQIQTQTQARIRVLAVVDNSDGRFCCLAEKLSRLKGEEVVLDVVFTESCREFCAIVDVMGIHGGDPVELRSGGAPVGGLQEALAARGLTGRVDLRHLGRVGIHVLLDGGIDTSHYDLILFDEQAPSPLADAGGNARRLAAASGIPVVHVRRCDRAGKADDDDRTALMAVWPGNGAAAGLLGYLARHAGTFSAIVIWIDDRADIEGTGRTALDAALRGIDPETPVEIHYRRDWLGTGDFRAALDRHRIGSIFVPLSPRATSLAAVWRKLRFRLISARRDVSRIYVGA